MRMTADQFKRKAGAEARNKYGAKRVTVQGIIFDSKREANRWLFLRDRQRTGEITDLKRQVPVMLQGRDGPILTRTGRPMRLTVDFVYRESSTNALVFEDSKGAITRDYEVRRAVAAAQGVNVVEV